MGHRGGVGGKGGGGKKKPKQARCGNSLKICHMGQSYDRTKTCVVDLEGFGEEVGGKMVEVV